MDHVERSYNFFRDMEEKGLSFTLTDVADATGWSRNTVRTYPSKKWERILTKNVDGTFSVEGVLSMSLGEYRRMHSQVNRLSSDPRKPELPSDVETLVTKAREAALLALDIYNRPATVFRSEGFLVMMVIAWTSVLHAVFQRESVDYFYKDSEGKHELIEGDLKAWELSQCVKRYYSGQTNPIVNNLEFAILLRNKIEHRFVPALDVHVAGECQALLLNFDELLTKEFGAYYSLREHLAVPLQTSSMRTSDQTEALRRFQGKNYDELIEFLDEFRSNLHEEIYSDSRYSFRVYLIPKIGNHRSSSDAAFEFVKYDPSKPAEMAALRKQVALIKDRQIPVVNPDGCKPSKVARLVSEAIGRPFTIYNHRQAYLKYKIRKTGIAPDSCKTKYCSYDAVHEDYVYTKGWVDFLVQRLTDAQEYDAVISFKI